MNRGLITAFLALPLAAQPPKTIQPPKAIQQDARGGQCNNIVALAGNININCSNLTPAEKKVIDSIPSVLNKILAHQLDPGMVMSALQKIQDELAARATTPETIAQGIKLANDRAAQEQQAKVNPEVQALLSESGEAKLHCYQFSSDWSMERSQVAIDAMNKGDVSTSRQARLQVQQAVDKKRADLYRQQFSPQLMRLRNKLSPTPPTLDYQMVQSSLQMSRVCQEFSGVFMDYYMKSQSAR